MTISRPGPEGQAGARHSAGWYDQAGEWQQLEPGDRLLISCEGGPSQTRLEVWPPRLELAEVGGVYVLIDVGPRAEWHYRFVADPGR